MFGAMRSTSVVVRTKDIGGYERIMYRTADFNCEECGYTQIVMFDRKLGPGEVHCDKCDALMVEGFPAPTVLRASLAEGQRRGDRWTYATESAKLEQEAVRQRKNGNKIEAAEMKAEARKLNDRASKSRDKTDT
jgi:hypothetical protein